ncbi:MAG: ECF transporter S component [Candidatus Micrarchaeia archaeon]
MREIRNSAKYVIALLFCAFFRILPRPPNVEPVMTATMPFAKEFGGWAGFFFAAFSIVIFDFLSGRVGYWTVYTSLAYGLVGYAAWLWLSKKKEVKGRDYAKFAFLSTIFYDAVTALAFGIQFGQSLEVTLLGQIPFTFYHLLGNVSMGYLISPLLHKWVIANPKLELNVYLG